MKDETKKRIESLSTDEMLFEINLGRRSHFQRDSFAHLKTCYQIRLSKENKKFPSEQSIAPDKPTNYTETKHKPRFMFVKKIIQGALIIVIGGLILALLYVVINHYFGLQLKP